VHRGYVTADPTWGCRTACRT